MFRAVNTTASPLLFTLEGISISHMSVFGAILRVVPPTPTPAEVPLESAKNTDNYRAACIISLSGPLLKHKTGHWRASGIGKALRKKIKVKINEWWSPCWPRFRIASFRKLSKAYQGCWFVKLRSQTCDLGKKTLQEQNVFFYLKFIQFCDYTRVSESKALTQIWSNSLRRTASRAVPKRFWGFTVYTNFNAVKQILFCCMDM